MTWRRAVGAAQEWLLSVVAVLGALAVVAATLCLVLDLRVLAFQSGSMSPTIRTGALAVARSVPAADLRRGDVVSVRTGSGSRVTHRIVEIERTGDRAVLRLKGDGNRVPDEASYPVDSADRVLFDVPVLGRAGSLVGSPAGLVGLGLLVGFLVVVLIGEAARPRHRAARSRAALAAVLALGALAPSALAGRSASTQAAWTDVATARTGAFTTAAVARPSSFTCGTSGNNSQGFTWSGVPGAVSYTVTYGSTFSPLTATVTGTSFTLTGPVAVGNAWVVANFGSWGSSVQSESRFYAVGNPSVCA
ncbi:signal peptidase I [Nocardioides marmoriginsengisoli]|uniref:Signal peptidase I n=1 Tax=Nocardioides marmoriginsengisoli TaxID=661483 RepID=A0A3N0CHN2_9ACTN|nr:signal peptidase I [Nocardioides marmoriginsengisoli]RNL62962.1 signal peptidase I [Nocardioides marmoriginsengisoli]